MILTGELIIESAMRGISFPTNNANNIDDDDILAFAYEEMVSKILPLVTSLRQEFLIAPPYSQSITAGTQRYRIPQRALARTMRNVIYVDAGGTRRDLKMIKPEDAINYMTQSTSSGPTEAFYVENDYLVLLPIPSETGASLEITYPLRPSKIIKTNDSGVIQSATPSTGIIVLDSALSTITTSTPIDIISSTSGNIMRSISLTPTNVSSATLTFAANAFDSSVAVGDYLCLAEESPVAQIPEEAHVVLARATQNRLLEAVGDLEALAVSQRILSGPDGKSGLLADLAALLTPRVEAKPDSAVGAANKYFLQARGRAYYPRIRI